jgi:hypothetical protein
MLHLFPFYHTKSSTNNGLRRQLTFQVIPEDVKFRSGTDVIKAVIIVYVSSILKRLVYVFRRASKMGLQCTTVGLLSV